MTPRALRPRERKLVAAAILVGVIALAYLAIVAPIVAGFEAREARRDQLATIHAHHQRTIAGIPRLRRQAERQRAASGDFVVAARSPEAAREALKERLQRVVEAAGGEFGESGDSETRPGWVRARGSARMSLAQLTNVLARLQNDPPYLIAESLTVAADEALVTGRPSILDVQLEVSIPLRPAPAR